MSTFERYLTLWVALCIVAGIALGGRAPGSPKSPPRMTFAPGSTFLIAGALAQSDTQTVSGVPAGGSGPS